MADLDANTLRSMLHYDPETGLFKWSMKPARNIRIGSLAGCFGERGYILIRIRGTLHKAHRLAWLYVYGEWPSAEIDHINGIPSDNRLCNLREVTRKQNAENVKLNSRNSSGFRGVHFVARLNKFLASVRHHRRTIYVGLFETAENAATAAAERRTQLFTHDDGRDRGASHA